MLLTAGMVIAILSGSPMSVILFMAMLALLIWKGE